MSTRPSHSVEKVDTGSRLVSDAGSTMEEIVASVKRVTDIMAEIMAASQEQSAGIEQVNQAVGQMDQVTQQNAALVEEAAAAAESMQEQARELAQTVAVFKLDSLSRPPAEFAQLPPVRSPALVRNERPVTKATPPTRMPRKPATKYLETVSPAGNEWESF